jgi:hypothetical protein
VSHARRQAATTVKYGAKRSSASAVGRRVDRLDRRRQRFALNWRNQCTMQVCKVVAFQLAHAGGDGNQDVS